MRSRRAVLRPIGLTSSWSATRRKLRLALIAARSLHELAPRQPMLLATASTIDVSVDALAEAGISDVLRRPLASTELAAALARCLRSPSTLHP